MAIGRTRIATIALRKWNRNRMQTRPTMMLSSISLSRRFLIAPLDQVEPVVAGDNFHARRQRRLEGFELRLDRFDGLERVLAIAHHDDAADASPFRSRSSTPRRMSGPRCTLPTSLDGDRRAVGVHADDDLLDVLQVLDVAHALAPCIRSRRTRSRAATSLFDSRIASTSLVSGMW